RTSPYPTLMTFDAPESTFCAVKREKSNTPLQALALMNDTVFVECAQALGHRLAAAPGDTSSRLKYAWKLCLAREPEDAELTRLLQLVEELRIVYRTRPKEAAKLARGDAESAVWVTVARMILNLDEFVTRE